MATLREDNYENEELFILKQARDKIFKAQRKTKIDTIKYEINDMYSSTLNDEDWAMLHSDNDSKNVNSKVINLFSMRSVFK
ncbi:hypothetical protein J6A31_01955 [bacterium]|nr:hypothetical protein [bacterium]